MEVNSDDPIADGAVLATWAKVFDVAASNSTSLDTDSQSRSGKSFLTSGTDLAEPEVSLAQVSLAQASLPSGSDESETTTSKQRGTPRSVCELRLEDLALRVTPEVSNKEEALRCLIKESQEVEEHTKRFLRQQRQQLQDYQSEMELNLLHQRIRIEQAMEQPGKTRPADDYTFAGELARELDLKRDHGRGVSFGEHDTVGHVDLGTLDMEASSDGAESAPEQPTDGLPSAAVGKGGRSSLQSVLSLLPIPRGLQTGAGPHAGRQGTSVFSGASNDAQSEEKDFNDGDHTRRSAVERGRAVKRAYMETVGFNNSGAKPSVMRRFSAALVDSGVMLTSAVSDMRFIHLRGLEGRVRSRRFQLTICAIICVNALFIGVTSDIAVKNAIEQYDTQASNSQALQSQWITVIDAVFCAIFLMELALRMAALEGEFFAGEDWQWNIFDAAVVVLSLAEMGLLIWGTRAGFVKVFRLARVARSLRVLRLMRFTNLASKLRMLVLALVHCKTMLMWAVLVLVLEMFLFAVVFLNAVSQFIQDASSSNAFVDDMKEYFGSIWMSMLTLFMAASGGLDWWTVIRLFLEIHIVYGLIFLIYIIVTVLALLNVVNSIFVHDAMASARMDMSLRPDADQGLLDTFVKKDILSETVAFLCSGGGGEVPSSQK